MSMTITEKILAKHASLEKVVPGQLILSEVDLSLANDVTAPLAIEELERFRVKKVVYPDKIVLIPDHFTPNKDIASAEQCKKMREFANQYGVNHYYEVGRMGIEHALLPEEGLIIPGALVIGADSHTCTHGALGAFATGVGSTDVAFSWITGKCWFKIPESIKVIFQGKLKAWVGGKDLILFLIGHIGVSGALYKTLEFSGETIHSLPMDERLSLCNMVIEAGAKNGIIAPDRVTLDYVQRVQPFHERAGRVQPPDEHRGEPPKGKLSPHTGQAGQAARPGKAKQAGETRKKMNVDELKSDEDAKYERVYEWDVSELEPQVAFPDLPSNVVSISEAQKKNIYIDQVVIGSCANGRITDLRIAAKILKGKKIHPKVRLIVIPATQKVYLQAMKEGLLETFIETGAVVSTPTCGPCLGAHMGVLAEGERALATTNRNFVGRMGHPKSEVYLANPAVAAATAIAGKIVSPDKL